MQYTSNEYKQVREERQKQKLKRQEENPKISKKTGLRTGTYFFEILRFFLASSFLVFVG